MIVLVKPGDNDSGKVAKSFHSMKLSIENLPNPADQLALMGKTMLILHCTLLMAICSSTVLDLQNDMKNMKAE